MITTLPTRLVTTAPARVFVTVCSWCGCWLKGPITDIALIRTRPPWIAVSDGICPSCKAQALRELEGMNLAPDK
jgi:hypothetical protein